MRPAGQTDVEVEQLLLLQHPVLRHGRGRRRCVVLERLEGELGAHPQPAVRPEVRQDLNLGMDTNRGFTQSFIELDLICSFVSSPWAGKNWADMLANGWNFQIEVNKI